MNEKILVVDDEIDLLKVTLYRLKKTGYEAFGAVDGQEALNLTRQIMPVMIILDVFLPTLNGDEVAKIIKRDNILKHIPILLISAAVENLEMKARCCGADGYLPKPFETEELLGAIKKHLAFGKRGQDCP